MQIVRKDTKACVLIPTLNPEVNLIRLINELLIIKNNDKTFSRLEILVVDDGTSNAASIDILTKIKRLKAVTVISHKKNFGKGIALKTGIKYSNKKKFSFIVTADSDGQHSANDVLRVLKASISHEKFVLGVRDFAAKNIPLKSKIGNEMTSLIFKLFYGKKINDTQTGLRAFPSLFFEPLIGTEGDRYEYEFNSLIEISKETDILSIPIETIYFDKNIGSNFRPFADSLLIYFVFFRHSSVAFLVSLFDFFMIYLVLSIYPNSLSFLITRTFTTHIYFYFIRKIVFKSGSNLLSQLLKFYLVALANILLSWILFDKIYFEQNYGFLLAYFTGIFVVYFLNFIIQKNFIFK